MANSLETQVKKLSLALGALADGAYMWAGADRGIKSELSGKDNGDTIFYRVTDLGTVSDPTRISDGAGDSTGSGSTYRPTGTSDGANCYAKAANIKQTVVPVSIRDINVMYEVKAFEKQCTSIGEVLAKTKVGQKMMKAAIKAQVKEDIKSISNIFVGGDFTCFQLAGAYMKSYVDSELYGFMDWNAWGRLTATGQQAVPCALAKPEYGKELVGSWTLINQLRVIPDLPIIEFADTDTVGSVSGTYSSGNIVLTFTAAQSATLPTTKYFMVKLGVDNRDTNDLSTGREAMLLVNAAEINTSNSKYTVEAPAWIKNIVAQAGSISFTCSVEAPASGKDKAALTIIRGENAQVFGTVDTVDCEGAHYSKSSVEGITIHENKEADVRSLKTYDRFDMVYACKLVEPRYAAMVLYYV